MATTHAAFVTPKIGCFLNSNAVLQALKMGAGAETRPGVLGSAPVPFF